MQADGGRQAVRQLSDAADLFLQRASSARFDFDFEFETKKLLTVQLSATRGSMQVEVDEFLFCVLFHCLILRPIIQAENL